MTIEWKETGLATMRLTIAMTAIAIIAMALRLTARLKTKGGFAWDDGLILLAFLFFFAVEACIVAGMKDNLLSYFLIYLCIVFRIRAKGSDHSIDFRAMYIWRHSRRITNDSVTRYQFIQSS